MNDMVEDHGAEASRTGHGENGLSAGQQRPILHHLRVACARDRLARIRHALVELGEDPLILVSQLVQGAPTSM